MATSNYDTIIYELKLLGRIKKDDKLTTSSEVLDIDPPSWLQPIYRTYNGDSKSETLKRVEQLCTQTFEFIKDSIPLLKSTKTSYKKNNPVEQLKNMWLEINAAINGLENLKVTYVGDSSVEIRLDRCIERFRDNISDIDNHVYKQSAISTAKLDSALNSTARAAEVNNLWAENPICGQPKTKIERNRNFEKLPSQINMV